jgi:Flp pilus assembly protein TadG
MAFALKLSPAFRAAHRKSRRLARNRAGGAAVEFAIIAPVLLLLLSGIFTYGGYFLTAHTVQQLANDAARAALSGLDDEERLALAQETLDAGLRNQRYMRGDLSSLELTRANEVMTATVTYDASEDMYWAFAALLPVPAPRIQRSASIRLGGW